MALQFGYHTDKNWRMVRSYGHSLLVIIPDNPRAFAKLYNPANPAAYFKELEKDFGRGHKGFVIAAYAQNGTQAIGHADGYLVAQINAPREMQAVQDFFAQADPKKWHFAAGDVFSPLKDEVFAMHILQLAKHYISYTRRHPVPYGTLYSIIEPGVCKKHNKAVNCNAFAYSLLRYAGANAVPDLYAQRVMPGIENLLPAKLFMPYPGKKITLPPLKKYTPFTLRKKQEAVRHKILHRLKPSALKK